MSDLIVATPSGVATIQSANAEARAALLSYVKISKNQGKEILPLTLPRMFAHGYKLASANALLEQDLPLSTACPALHVLGRVGGCCTRAGN